MLRTLARVNDVNTVMCHLTLRNSFHSTNMIRTRVRGNLRMRKQNAKTTVPLDVVPEYRTKRFPSRFQLVGRFCELRFRYVSSSTDREGEIRRPLDHMRQISFIHSARLIDTTDFYCRFSHDVTKIETTKLLILLRFNFMMHKSSLKLLFIQIFAANESSVLQ